VPTPRFVEQLRQKIGHDPLWLPGVTAVVVRPGAAGVDEVLVVQRADTGAWTVIGGIVEPGEHPADAARREIWEESGVTARITRLAWVCVTPPITYPNGDQVQYVSLVFRCEWVSGTPRVNDDESRQAKFCPVDQLPAMGWHFNQAVQIALEDRADTSLEPAGDPPQAGQAGQPGRSGTPAGGASCPLSSHHHAQGSTAPRKRLGPVGLV
jgi:8-oxo-dGTP pyrophosphatase MutT (NUDIX family)